MLCWLIIPYTLLMISSGKRQVYVLPLYAAEVLLIANMIDQIYRDKFKLPAKFDYINLLTVILVFVFCGGLLLGPVAFVIIAMVGKLSWTAYIAPALMLLCGVWVALGLRRKHLSKVLFGLLAGLAMTYISIDTAARPIGNARKSYSMMFKYCEQEIKTGKVLYLYKPIERESGAAVFYLGHTCPNFNFKKTKATPNMIILINKSYSEPFVKAGFKMEKEFKLERRKYWVMKYE